MLSVRLEGYIRAGRKAYRPWVDRFGRFVHSHMVSMSVWVIVTAVLIGLAIAWLGITALRAASGVSVEREPSEVEDVEDLEVSLVCRECGTELRFTRLGELQIPRHCGEPMEVVRRTPGA